MMLRAAAVKTCGGRIHEGGAHWVIVEALGVAATDDIEFGYIDGDGNFVTLDGAAAWGIQSSDDLDLIDDFQRSTPHDTTIDRAATILAQSSADLGDERDVETALRGAGFWREAYEPALERIVDAARAMRAQAMGEAA